jgi:type VI secretion system protein ImpK
VRSGRQRIADAEAFRAKAKAALQDVERDAIAAGYDVNDIKETHFAVVAFLDWVILRSDEPIRADWERRPLQEELFGHAHAGDIFFEKLNRISERRDSPELADILEIFLLCLLLGFQGRYSGALATHADGIAETVRRRIEHIRGPQPSLWPTGPAATPFRAIDLARPDRRLVYAMVSAAGAALLLFTLFKSNLTWTAGNLRFGFM